MRRIKVYYGIMDNVYITDKEMPQCYEIIGEFDNVSEAQEAVDAEEGLWPYLDRDLLDESFYSFEGDDYELFTFDHKEYV